MSNLFFVGRLKQGSLLDFFSSRASIITNYNPTLSIKTKVSFFIVSCHLCVIPLFFRSLLERKKNKKEKVHSKTHYIICISKSMFRKTYSEKYNIYFKNITFCSKFFVSVSRNTTPEIISKNSIILWKL